MSTRAVEVTAVILYFAVLLFIGWLAGKKTKNLKDYMIGGQSLGVWITSLGIMAAIMSGFTWLGNPGASYVTGYAACVRFYSTSPIGLLLAYFVLSKPIRIISERTKCYTLPDILAARWNHNRVIRLLSCLIILVGSITFLVSQWTAMGTAMESMLGIDYKYGVLIGAIIITLYVMAGGMLASMWTNFFQMIIMFVVALLLIVKSVNVSGGFVEMNHMIANINPTYVSPYGTYGVSYLLTYSILVCFLSYGGQPTLNTKFMMIKNTKELKWSPLISVVALIVGTSMFIVGIAGIVLVNNGTIEAPARADLILLSVIKAIFPPIVSALVLVAVMAAVMSTAESYLFNCSASLVRDLGEQFLGVQMNDKKSLRWSRIIMVLVAIFTVILAMRPPKMISVVGAQAFGAFCAGFGPVLYLGIRWKRVTSKAAIAGMSVGLVVAGIIPILDPNNMLMPKWTPAGMAALLSFVVTVIVTLITKPETSIVFDSVPQPAADATQETGAKASEQF